MYAESVKALLNRYWLAASERRFDDLREMFADDVVVEWPQSGEHFRGKEACINIFVNYPGGSPRLEGVERVTGEGSVWVAEGKITYPDGRTWMVVGIFELRDGRIAHEVDYFTEPFPVPEWRKGAALSE